MSDMKPMSMSSNITDSMNRDRQSDFTLFMHENQSGINLLATLHRLSSTILMSLFLCIAFVALFFIFSKPSGTNGNNGNSYSSTGSIVMSFEDDLIPMTSKSDQDRPIDIRGLIRKTTLRAREKGILQTIQLDTPHIMIDGNFEFVVTKLKTDTLARKMSSEGDYVDALNILQMDKNLIVSEIPPFHTLTLNKYNTINDHTLLISDYFEEQSSLLNARDLDAWYFCVSSIGAIGFYNSDMDAGASQRHRHMQLIPLDEVLKFYLSSISRDDDVSNPIPLDRIIDELKYDNKWQPATWTSFSERVYRIPHYHIMNHAFVYLLTPREFSTYKVQKNLDSSLQYRDYLRKVYFDVLHYIGAAHLTSCPNSLANLIDLGIQCTKSHNILLTSNWLFIIERQRNSEIHTSLHVNGLGFAGFLLAKNEEQLDLIRSIGPMTILQNISQPLQYF